MENGILKYLLGKLSLKKIFNFLWINIFFTSSNYFSTQVRTSYVPNEILWGYRFENSCITYDKSKAKYAINIGNLDKIVPDNTPR